MLAQHANDLILGKTASPHHPTPPDELTSQWHDFQGAGHSVSTSAPSTSTPATIGCCVASASPTPTVRVTRMARCSRWRSATRVSGPVPCQLLDPEGSLDRYGNRAHPGRVWMVGYENSSAGERKTVDPWLPAASIMAGGNRRDLDDFTSRVFGDASSHHRQACSGRSAPIGLTGRKRRAAALPCTRQHRQVIHEDEACARRASMHFSSDAAQRRIKFGPEFW